MGRKREITKEALAETYGNGSFRNVNKTKFDEDGKELPASWKGYVYASDKQAIYGTGPTKKKARERAEENRVWYHLLLQNGVEGKAATARIAAARKGKSACLIHADLLLALGLKPSDPKPSKPLPPDTTSAQAPSCDAEASETINVDEDDMPRPDITVRAFVETYFLRLAVKTKKIETRRRNERFARMIAEYEPVRGGSRLGDREFRRVGINHVQALVAAVRDRQTSEEQEGGDNYGADFVTFLRRVLTWAHAYGFTPSDFGKVLPKISRPSGKKPLRVRSDDVQRLLNHATDPRMRAFIMLGYMSGCASEILGIPFDSIEGNTVRLEWQVGRLDNPAYDPTKPLHSRTNPKTVKALVPWLKREHRSRLIQLTDEVMSELMRSVELSKPTKVRTPQGSREVRMLIPNEAGGLWQAHHFRLQWNELCRRADVKFQAHQFRALLTREERGRGLALDHIAAWLGHSGTAVTESAYLRYEEDENPVAEVQIERAERLGQMMRG